MDVGARPEAAADGGPALSRIDLILTAGRGREPRAASRPDLRLVPASEQTETVASSPRPSS